MRSPSTGLGAAWLAGCLWWGVACLPPRAPEAAPDEPSAHADLADVCDCADAAAEAHLATAFAGIHGAARSPAPADDFIACTSAITAIPSAAAYAASDDAPDWSRLPAATRSGLYLNQEGALQAAVIRDGVLVGERSRLRSIAVAFRENVLAAHACQSIAIAVATYAALEGQPSRADRALVDSAAKRGRAAAIRAGLALALSAALDATLRRAMKPAELTELAEQLDASALDGSLADATGRAWSIATRVRSAALAAWIGERGDQLTRRSRRPVSMSSAPSLSSLVGASEQRRDAEQRMLSGLLGHDVGAVMRGAAPLHGRHDPAYVLLAASRRALADDFAGALQLGRDVVPIYSDAAAPLEALAKRLGKSP